MEIVLRFYQEIQCQGYENEAIVFFIRKEK